MSRTISLVGCLLMCTGFLHSHIEKRLMLENLLPHKGAVGSVTQIHGQKGYLEHVHKSMQPVIVNVYSQKSTKGNVNATLFTQLAAELSGKVSFCQMDAAEEIWFLHQLAIQLKIQKVQLPLTLFIKDGKIQSPIVQGQITGEKMKILIKQNFFN